MPNYFISDYTETIRSYPENYWLASIKDNEIIFDFVNIAKRDVKIQYVHQLQNLYFILTGKELTYSDVI